MFTARFKGVSEARTGLKGWSPTAFVEQVGPQASKVLLTWLRYYIAYKTGQTSKSLGTDVAGTHVRATGNLVAWFLFSGTKPHPITARNAKVLAFPWQGGFVFRHTVMHPGTGGTNYPTAAWQAARPELQVIARRTGAQLLRGRS